MELGTHVIFDAIIDEKTNVGNASDIIKQACANAGATIVDESWHVFENGGFTGVVLLAESHATIHYWIEHDAISVDVYMCGDCKPDQAALDMLKKFGPVSFNFRKFRRKMP